MHADIYSGASSFGSASSDQLWQALETGDFDAQFDYKDTIVQEAQAIERGKAPESLAEQLAAVQAFVKADATARKKPTKASRVAVTTQQEEQDWRDVLARKVTKHNQAVKKQDEKSAAELEAKRLKQVFGDDTSTTLTPRGANALLELAKNARDEKILGDALKEDVLKEYLESTKDIRPELLDQVETKVEKLYNDLTPEEFNKVFLEARVENAKLKAAAVKFMDPNNALNLPPTPDAANNIESSTILEMFNRSKPPALRQYDVLSALLGATALSPSQEDIKRALKAMPQLSDSAAAAEAAAKTEVPDLTNDPLASIRDLVQNMVDMRQSVLRVYSGVKTGHRGRSPVIAYVQRDEDLIH
jgi:Amidase